MTSSMGHSWNRQKAEPVACLRHPTQFVFTKAAMLQVVEGFLHILGHCGVRASSPFVFF